MRSERSTVRGERTKCVRRDPDADNWRHGGGPRVQFECMPGDLADLVAWREAALLARDAIAAARRIQGVGAAAAADQLVRAAESISANIAEAYGRGFGKDGTRFLRVARGSATELESHLWIACETRRIPVPVAGALMSHTRRVRALLRGLIQSSAGCAPRG